MGGTDNCICKLRNFFQSAISAIKLQSQQSDCNLSNQTAISTIRLQSPQSECRDHATSPRSPGTDNCICKLRNFFQSAISAIRVQSQQSDCISTIRVQRSRN